MPLSRSQRRILTVYQTYRDRPMTMASLVWASRKNYAILLLFYGVFIALAFGADIPLLGGGLVIALVAILLRDIGYFRRSVAIWPALNQVIDWKRVEEKLKAE